MAKQKLKTHKAMAKRLKITGSGSILRRKVAIKKHRSDKTQGARRAKRKVFSLATGDRRRLKRLLPYAKL
jgi:large subunit ribosomal protein L35